MLDNHRIPDNPIPWIRSGWLGQFDLSLVRKLQLFGQSTKKKREYFKQDKGHASAWNEFVNAVIKNSEAPIPYAELIGTAYVILACDQSMQTGQSVNIKDFIHAK